ncbi:hypothetical protein ABZ894_19685 [Nocardia beijingensis]|uniref:hypothetical protein n=1 Tax=Nocardia beijingensis TaxID=95162 RepID=UPI0033EA9D9E
MRASPGFGAVGRFGALPDWDCSGVEAGFGAPLACGPFDAEPGRGAPPVSGWFDADAGFGVPLGGGGFGMEPGFGAPLVSGWFDVEAGFDAPLVSRCFDADLLSISVVSASAPVVRLGSGVPVPVRAAWPPTLSAGAFARPGPAGPEGAVPLTPGALEAGGGVFWLPAGVAAGRLPWGCVGAFGFPALGAEPAGGGVFWLPAGVVAGRPAWGCAAAGPFGLPALPGAEPECGGVFWLPAGVVAGRPAWGCAAAGVFGLPALPGADTDAPPAGLGAELGDGAFASAAGPDDGVPLDVAPPALGAADSLRAPAAGGFEEAGRAAEPVRLSGVTGFAPLAAPGEGGCPAPALCAVPAAGPETPDLWAEAGEFGLLAGPFAGFVPPTFGVASVPLDEVGPLPGSAGAWAPGALGTGPPAPAPAFGLAAEAPGPEADGPVPAGAAFGRCALAMRSVGAADAAGPLLSAAGVRFVAAPGRASAPAVSAGSALFRAGFFSSFGSDTHTPRQSGTV